MILSLHVKTGKRATRVTKTSVNEYTVEVTARPEKGRANDAVLRALAKHLNFAPSRLKIVSGQTSKKKVVEIL
ncbi:MAG: DUF167 domain-containing protein [Patescibacteria group bacterium]